MKRETFYTGLYGPEALRGELQMMLGTIPRIIGNGTIPDYKLTFSCRRGVGIVPSMEPAQGKELPLMVFHLEYYELRRLERRLGYPMGIRRATFDGLIEGIHPERIVTYYVPLNRAHGAPSDRLYEQMRRLYQENAWDEDGLIEAVQFSATETPKIKRIK